MEDAEIEQRQRHSVSGPSTCYTCQLLIGKKHFMELFRKHHPDTNIAKNGQEVSILFCEETGAKRIKGGSQRVSTMLTWERGAAFMSDSWP